MVGKIPVNFLLLMTAVSIVFSCLVTNCPRGGKRGKPDFRIKPNELISSGMKKCRLCSHSKENCFGVHCTSQISCGSKGPCVTSEECCSKKLCELQGSCESYLSSGHDKGRLNSLLLTKILRYNL